MADQNELDKVANLWNKTKDTRYRDLWYKLIKETYGSNIGKRRIISVSSCHKGDDGGYIIIGKSRLL